MVLNPTRTVFVFSIRAIHFLDQRTCLLFLGTFSGRPGDGETEFVGFYENRITVKAAAQFCETFQLSGGNFSGSVVYFTFSCLG